MKGFRVRAAVGVALLGLLAAACGGDDGDSEAAGGGGGGGGEGITIALGSEPTTLDPQIREDGSLWMPARWVSVGRLAVPGDWVIDHADRRRDQFIPEDLKDLPETAAMFRAFAGEAPIATDAVVTLGDGRVVRLLEMRPADGRLELTCRTEHDGG